MKHYDNEQVEALIQKYIYELGGEMSILDEGTLGYGKLVLHSAPGKKEIVITEKYWNEWSSVHTIRCYKKLPKKYADIV